MESAWTWIPTLVSSSVYLGVHATFAQRMLRRRPPPRGPARLPRVSILKPVSGIDDELRENLESFARLDYPDYEILFGLASPDDPALTVLREFIAANEAVRARIIWTDPDAATNPKVAQMIGLVRESEAAVVVVSDANVRVAPSYLRELVGALMRPGVGLVSSLVVGSGERTIGASLENAQLGAFIAPSIVVSSLVGRAITVGKSMALRRADLEVVGGFRSVGGVLAEDDVLGQRFRNLGYGVELCLHAVHNRNVYCSVARSVERHTRWAKMRRAIAPRCFPFELLLTPMLIASAVLCIAPSTTALRALCAAWALQCLGVTTALRILRQKWPSWQIVALEPLRALILFACWLRAWASRRVEWRGNSFRVGAGTELMPITIEAPASGRIPL
jgi:ceramide glucosyltransferase